MIDFTGKTVLVTGGGVGIGRGIAEAFSRAGAKLVIAEIDPDRAAEAAAALPGVEVVVCDVRDRSTPPEGIRVNDVAPETTDTPQVALDAMIPPENRANMDKWIPLGRFGTPEDCAGAALYLASPLAAWVTGTAIHVDGGALAAAGWTRTPAGEWTVVPMVTGNGLRMPGA